MTPKRVFASVLFLCALGCESDPAPGSGFHDKFVRQSEVIGTVYVGPFPAEAAVVRIADARKLAAPPQTQTTIGGGRFRFIEAPPTYDLVARADARVLAREGLTARFFDPSFDGSGTLRAWTARLDVTVSGARPGHSLQFFASKDKTLAVSGDVASGLTVSFADYTSRIAVTAVEVPNGEDATRAVSSARVELDVRAGTTTPAHFALVPIDREETLSFAAKGAAGFVPDPAVVHLDFGRYETRTPVARIVVGAPHVFRIIPDAVYVVTLRARRADGAEVDSGHVFFGFGDPVLQVPIPDAAPALGSPSQGEIVAADATLTVPEPGVVEHLLEPMDPKGVTFSLGSSSGSARLPDLTSLGLPRATGWYRWRARRYSDVDFIDRLAGPFVRVGPSAWSAPRTIALQ